MCQRKTENKAAAVSVPTHRRRLNIVANIAQNIVPNIVPNIAPNIAPNIVPNIHQRKSENKAAEVNVPTHRRRVNIA